MADVSLRALRMRFAQRRGHAAVRSDRHRTTTTSGGRVTPTVIQRLREALGNERMQCIGMQPFEFYQQAQGLTYDAIAAVEQELATKDAEIARLKRIVAFFACTIK